MVLQLFLLLLPLLEIMKDDSFLIGRTLLVVVVIKTRLGTEFISLNFAA